MRKFWRKPLPLSGWLVRGMLCIFLYQCCSCALLRRVHLPEAASPKPNADDEAETGAGLKPNTATSPGDLTPGVAPAGVAAEKGADPAGYVPSENWRPTLTGWKHSAADAIAEARVENKPLLVAVTNQQVENAQQFESSLLASKDFRDAAGDAFIFLNIDYGDKETIKSDYYRDFKTRLNIRGFPTLLILLPDGREIVRLRGYVTDWKGRYVQSVKDARPHVEQAIELRRKQMKKNGYRLWSGRKDVQVFAKLVSVDANQATFTGEWGGEFSTFITRLSEADQKWIGEHFK